MHRLAVSAVLLAVLAAALFRLGTRPPIDRKYAELYRRWRGVHGRLYASPSEQEYRFEVFVKNVQRIEEVNRLQASYRLEANQFADLSLEEIQARYLGLKQLHETQSSDGAPIPQLSSSGFADIPLLSKDWSEEDGLHQVVHQRSCGSCYAWSAVTALEHAYFQKHKLKVRLSVQELVDCSEENGGCVGGWMHMAFDYAMAKGLNTFDAYPYIAEETGECEAKQHSRVFNLLKGYVRIDEHDPSHILQALHSTVVPSAVNANELAFYKAGVFDKQDCRTDVNHAVVIVGFGEQAGKKYWKVRNTWGQAWGERGYFRLLRSDSGEGICGITKYNVYPTL